jgi:hypothetical protein
MSQRLPLGGRLRWMSAAAVVVVASVLAGTMLANAASPALAKRTPAQLLADMQHASAPSAFSAVITQSANLGFPSLPDIAGLSSPALSAANWISGTHTVDVWYGGPRHLRIAVPVSFGETDLRVNGTQVWLWDSRTQTATRITLPAHLALPARAALPARVALPAAARLPRVIGRCLFVIGPGHPGASPRAKLPQLRTKVAKCLRGLKLPGGVFPGRVFRATPMTPQQIATRLLAAVGPTTKVSVAGSVVVAGRPAYQLVIAPRTDQSLIGRIVIAVDSQTYLPLQVQVFAVGASDPAFSVGFTALTFGLPAASNFSFTPPAGSHVKTEQLPAVLPGGLLGGLGVLGGVAQFSSGGSAKQVPARPRMSLSIRVALGRPVIKLPSGKLIKLPSGKFIRLLNGKRGYVVLPGAGLPAPPLPGALLSGGGLSGERVLGRGWLSVVVIPAGVPLLGQGGLSQSAVHGFAPVMIGSAGPSRPAAQLAGLLGVLFRAAKPVRGAWGSGRLLQTTLFSALITNQGQVLIGAVTPAVLFADAAKVK